MELVGKLQVHGDGFALLLNDKLVAFDSKDFTNDHLLGELSTENCQAIANGYDLDTLVDEEFQKFDQDIRIVYRRQLQESLANMFQKALEIFGDREFSEEDMRKAVYEGVKIGRGTPFIVSATDEYLKSLQQTEWDVTVDMEETSRQLSPGAICIEDSDYLAVTGTPKLDSKRKLILKRK